MSRPSLEYDNYHAKGFKLMKMNPPPRVPPQIGGYTKQLLKSTPSVLVMAKGTPPRFIVECWLWKVVGCYKKAKCAVTKRSVFRSVALTSGAWKGMQQKQQYKFKGRGDPSLPTLPATVQDIHFLDKSKDLCSIIGTTA